MTVLTDERRMKLQEIIEFWNGNRTDGEAEYTEDLAISTLLSLKIDEEFERIKGRSPEA